MITKFLLLYSFLIFVQSDLFSFCAFRLFYLFIYFSSLSRVLFAVLVDCYRTLMSVYVHIHRYCQYYRPYFRLVLRLESVLQIATTSKTPRRQPYINIINQDPSQSVSVLSCDLQSFMDSIWMMF